MAGLGRRTRAITRSYVTFCPGPREGQHLSIFERLYTDGVLPSSVLRWFQSLGPAGVAAVK